MGEKEIIDELRKLNEKIDQLTLSESDVDRIAEAVSARLLHQVQRLFSSADSTEDVSVERRMEIRNEARCGLQDWREKQARRGAKETSKKIESKDLPDI